MDVMRRTKGNRMAGIMEELNMSGENLTKGDEVAYTIEKMERRRSAEKENV